MTEREAKAYEAKLHRLRSKYPCRGCAYYTACGDPERTRECSSRKRLAKQKLVVRKRSGVMRGVNYAI